MTTAVLRNGYSWQGPRRSVHVAGAILARRIRAWLRLHLLKLKRLQMTGEADVERMDDHLRRDIGLEPLPRRPMIPEIGWL